MSITKTQTLIEFFEEVLKDKRILYNNNVITIYGLKIGRRYINGGPYFEKRLYVYYNESEYVTLSINDLINTNILP